MNEKKKKISTVEIPSDDEYLTGGYKDNCIACDSIFLYIEALSWEDLSLGFPSRFDSN